MTEHRSIVRRLTVSLTMAVVFIGLAAGADDPGGKIEAVMKKMNKNFTKLRKFNKLSNEQLKTQGSAAAKVANEMVSLTESVQNNTHYVAEAKKKGVADADTKWKTTNKEMIDHLKELAAAAEKPESAAVKKAFSGVSTACNNCHDAFRVETDE